MSMKDQINLTQATGSTSTSAPSGGKRDNLNRIKHDSNHYGGFVGDYNNHSTKDSATSTSTSTSTPTTTTTTTTTVPTMTPSGVQQKSSIEHDSDILRGGLKDSGTTPMPTMTPSGDSTVCTSVTKRKSKVQSDDSVSTKKPKLYIANTAKNPPKVTVPALRLRGGGKNTVPASGVGVDDDDSDDDDDVPIRELSERAGGKNTAVGVGVGDDDSDDDDDDVPIRKLSKRYKNDSSTNSSRHQTKKCKKKKNNNNNKSSSRASPVSKLVVPPPTRDIPSTVKVCARVKWDGKAATFDKLFPDKGGHLICQPILLNWILAQQQLLDLRRANTQAQRLCLILIPIIFERLYPGFDLKLINNCKRGGCTPKKKLNRVLAILASKLWEKDRLMIGGNKPQPHLSQTEVPIVIHAMARCYPRAIRSILEKGLDALDPKDFDDTQCHLLWDKILDLDATILSDTEKNTIRSLPTRGHFRGYSVFEAEEASASTSTSLQLSDAERNVLRALPSTNSGVATGSGEVTTKTTSDVVAGGSLRGSMVLEEEEVATHTTTLQDVAEEEDGAPVDVEEEPVDYFATTGEEAVEEDVSTATIIATFTTTPGEVTGEELFKEVTATTATALQEQEKEGGMCNEAHDEEELDEEEEDSDDEDDAYLTQEEDGYFAQGEEEEEDYITQEEWTSQPKQDSLSQQSQPHQPQAVDEEEEAAGDVASTTIQGGVVEDVATATVVSTTTTTAGEEAAENATTTPTALTTNTTSRLPHRMEMEDDATTSTQDGAEVQDVGEDREEAVEDVTASMDASMGTEVGDVVGSTVAEDVSNAGLTSSNLSSSSERALNVWHGTITVSDPSFGSLTLTEEQLHKVFLCSPPKKAMSTSTNTAAAPLVAASYQHDPMLAWQGLPSQQPSHATTAFQDGMEVKQDAAVEEEEEEDTTPVDGKDAAGCQHFW